jgi:hypothetical protein
LREILALSGSRSPRRFGPDQDSQPPEHASGGAAGEDAQTLYLLASMLSGQEDLAGILDRAALFLKC